jgi:hypothetical protein
VYSNLIYAGTLAMARYSMPLYPTLIIFAAGGLGALASNWAAVRGRQTPARPRDTSRAALAAGRATSSGQ